MTSAIFFEHIEEKSTQESHKHVRWGTLQQHLTA